MTFMWAVSIPNCAVRNTYNPSVLSIRRLQAIILTHDFLSWRIRDIARGYDFIDVEDDIHTEVAFVGSVFIIGSKAVYFQGSDIIVRVDGTDEGNESTHLFEKEIPVSGADSS
jgi:hypothetical protein